MKRNPWKGLVSYEEKDLDNYEFCGRTKAIGKYYSLITSNLISTLYGKTGCGKTSMLQAGIFPLLRHESYFPVMCRLSLRNKKYSFADYLVERVEQEIGDLGFSCKESNIPVNQVEDLEKYRLWKYFYGHDFHGKDNNVVFPVIVLDQFEEVLINSKDDSLKFLEQVSFLVGEDLLLPDDCYANFRLTISLREDFLYLMEDTIDEGNLRGLRDNRMRLTSLTIEEAEEVINLGDDLIKDADRKEIYKSICKLAKNRRGHISTNMLSLICSQIYFLYSKKPGNELVTADDMKQLSEDPLGDFYRKSIKDLNEDSIIYIENNLVLNGFRRPVTKQEFEARVPASDRDRLTKGETKILQFITANDNECVELIHDRLSEVINERKKERKKQKDIEERFKANYQKFISRQNPLTLGGRRIWDNKTFTFSVDNSRSTSLNNSSSRAEILNDLLQQNKNEDRGVEQLFFDKLFRQTVDTGKISLNFNDNCSKDGISVFEIETERVRGSKQLKIKSIKFYDSNRESFYTADGFCEIKSEYDKETGYEIKRVYICDGYTSVGIASVVFSNFKEFVFGDYKGGLPQKAMYFDSKNNPCKHIDGNYGVKIDYDDYGNETCRCFLDKDGKVTPIYNGISGVVSEYDSEDRVKKQYFVNQEGNPVTDDYGFHGVEFKYNEAPNELLVSETRYIDVNDCLCNNPQRFCIEQFQYDLKGRIIWQFYLDKDRKEIEKKDGVYLYSKLKIGYNESDRPNNLAMYNLSGNIFKVVRYTYDPKGTIKECGFYEIKKTQNGQIERKSKSNDNDVHKIKYEHDKHGFLIRQSFFNKEDNSTNDRNGYCKIYLFYSHLGELLEQDLYNNEKSENVPVQKTFYKYMDNGTCEITQINYEIITEAKTKGKVLGFIKKKEREQKGVEKETLLLNGVINHRRDLVKIFCDKNNEYIADTPLTVRRKYDIDGNVVEELLYDKYDKDAICDEDGVYGWHVEYDLITGLKRKMSFLGKSGNVTNNRYNYAIVKYSFEEYEGEKYFATSYYDENSKKTICENGYHKRLETDSPYNDDLCKQIIFLNCFEKPSDCNHGYHKQVFYDDQDNKRRIVSFFNSELQPVINKDRGFHRREELFSDDGLLLCRSYLNEVEHLVNVGDGFAKQKIKRYDSFKTLFYYPFIDHDVIRFYDDKEQKVNVEYKGYIGYKFLEPTNDIALIKVENSKGKIIYWNKSLLWRCINIVWVPLAIALILIIYPLYSLFNWLYNLCLPKQAAIPESASIIRIAQIFDDVPQGESSIQAPIRQYDVEEGCWIIRWNNWSYNCSQDTATEFETELNNSPVRKIITFYNPNEKIFLDVEITSPNIGLRIQDAQVPKNDVFEMMERWEQFKKNYEEI
jgi:hypothetical protein